MKTKSCNFLLESRILISPIRIGGSADPDPDPDLDQNDTDPQH